MNILEDEISTKVIIFIHGLGSSAKAFEIEKVFFLKRNYSIIRINLEGDSLKKNTEEINEVIEYARKYKKIFIVAKSLSGPAAIMAKKINCKILWDPSLDLQWVSTLIHYKHNEPYISKYKISNELIHELNSINITDLITDEFIFIAEEGPYTKFATLNNTTIIKGADHKFSRHKTELCTKTLEILESKANLEYITSP